MEMLDDCSNWRCVQVVQIWQGSNQLVGLDEAGALHVLQAS